MTRYEQKLASKRINCHRYAKGWFSNKSKQTMLANLKDCD